MKINIFLEHFQSLHVNAYFYILYHTQALVVLSGLPVMSENEKMLDKPQTHVDILTTLFNCP